MHWATRLIKIHWTYSLNIKRKIPSNYPVSWTHWKLVGKTTQKSYLSPRENNLFFYLWYFFHYRIRYHIFFEGNISTLDNVPQGCGCKCYWKFKNFLSDYRIIINMEFLYFGERCRSPIISVFQIVLRGKQENPLSREIGNFAGGIFLSGGIWQGVILSIWTFFKAKNKIL